MVTLISACTTYSDISTTAFHQNNLPTHGSIYVTATDPAISDSLEFNHYKSLVEFKLAEKGYRITPKSDADLIVSFSYGIEFVQTSSTISTYPSSGLNTSVGVGRSSRGRHASVGIHTGSVNATVSSNSEYVRVLALDLLDAQSVRDGKPNKIYQATVKNTGKCTNLNGIFDDMLFAMFLEFPGESGNTEVIKVETEENC